MKRPDFSHTRNGLEIMFTMAPSRRLFCAAAAASGKNARVGGASGIPLADFAFALDIDGVLLRGKSALPGATEALRLLQQHRVPFGGFAAVPLFDTSVSIPL